MHNSEVNSTLCAGAVQSREPRLSRAWREPQTNILIFGLPEQTYQRIFVFETSNPSASSSAALLRPPFTASVRAVICRPRSRRAGGRRGRAAAGSLSDAPVRRYCNPRELRPGNCWLVCKLSENIIASCN